MKQSKNLAAGSESRSRDSKLSPVGTNEINEISPGRQSWVGVELMSSPERDG